MRIALIVLLALQIGCSNTKENSAQQESENTYPPLLEEVFESHVGIDHWKSFSSLTYQVDTNSLTGHDQEVHTVVLNNRKVLIEHDTSKIGYDGSEAWVTPSKEAFGRMSPRFYHNLLFYFFSFPFIASDDGIIIDESGDQSLKNKTYQTIKISYEKGVGDTPEDYYTMFINPDTKQMEWLLYTVTYFSGKAHKNYNALHYSDWQRIDGLMVPEKFTGYKYENGEVTEIKRYYATFSNIKFSKKAPEQSIFEMPKGAQIDSLPDNLQ